MGLNVDIIMERQRQREADRRAAMFCKAALPGSPGVTISICNEDGNLVLDEDQHFTWHIANDRLIMRASLF